MRTSQDKSINRTTKERMVLTKNGQEPGSSWLDGYIFSFSLSLSFALSLPFSTSLSVRVSLWSWLRLTLTCTWDMVHTRISVDRTLGVHWTLKVARSWFELYIYHDWYKCCMKMNVRRWMYQKTIELCTISSTARVKNRKEFNKKKICQISFET